MLRHSHFCLDAIMIIEMNISINHIIPHTVICSITAGKACISTNLRSHIMNPPDVVIILHQGGFCLLLVFTGSVYVYPRELRELARILQI
jgi:hypothetical protein